MTLNQESRIPNSDLIEAFKEASAHLENSDRSPAIENLLYRWFELGAIFAESYYQKKESLND